MHKLFRYPIPSETLKGCPRIFSTLWELKFSTQNVIPAFTYYAKNFPIPQFFWNSAAMNTKFFVTVRPKIFIGKMLYAPHFFRKNFATPVIFSKTVGYLYKSFQHCEKNNFRRKIVTPLICIKFFYYPKLSETLERCLQSFRHCQSWNFWQKNVIPLICISLPVNTIFLTHCRDAHEDFRY